MKTFVGDIGTEILLDSGSTITDATVQKIYYKKPQTGDKGFWVGSIKDTTKVSYTILVDDLDESGEWVLQIYVETPSWTGWGEEFIFNVYDPKVT